MARWLLSLAAYQGAQVRKLHARVVVLTARIPSGVARDFWLEGRQMAGSVMVRLKLFNRLFRTNGFLSSPYRYYLRPFPREAIRPSRACS